MRHLFLSEPFQRGLRLLGLSLAIGVLVWILAQAWVLSQRSQSPPTAIVVLGGGIKREAAAAHLAKQLPDLPVIISSGSRIPCLYRVFVQEYQVDWERIKVDLRAGDTLTNFTAVLPYLQQHRHHHVILITSEGHLRRSRLLAHLIWGSHGIATRPYVISGVGHNESWLKLMADSLRGLAWILLGDWVAHPFYHSPDRVQSSATQRQSQCEIGSADLPLTIDPQRSLIPQEP